MIQDYGFRLYNPAIGKFLSVDPLAPDFPELTPYQFAGNMPISAIDLDGLEPVVMNDIYGRRVLIGYRPYPNQGFTQIAADINNPQTQETFGYCLIKPVKWTDIVRNDYNWKKYVSPEIMRGNMPAKAWNDNTHEAWKSLNLNPTGRNSWVDLTGCSEACWPLPEPEPDPYAPSPPPPLSFVETHPTSSGNPSIGLTGIFELGGNFLTITPDNDFQWEMQGNQFD